MRGTFADKEKKKEKKKAKTMEQAAAAANKKPGQGTPNAANTQGTAAPNPQVMFPSTVLTLRSYIIAI